MQFLEANLLLDHNFIADHLLIHTDVVGIVDHCADRAVLIGFTMGPVGAAILLGLATGMIAATAVWDDTGCSALGCVSRRLS